ncbi:hypothetical protein G9274_001929 [Stenotrophomonas rhizophila]|nr:hypothetical protein G9274_001929 [Stenotrophomonas rhizophila]
MQDDFVAALTLPDRHLHRPDHHLSIVH